MADDRFRIEHDSMGEVRVPEDALYAAQTQRAVENFPISGVRFSRTFIRALGLIKGAAAYVNSELGVLDSGMSEAIQAAAKEVEEGKHDRHFPLDIFQTGSGTSTNMNSNEVIANLRLTRFSARSAATRRRCTPTTTSTWGSRTNDMFPTAIHVAAYLEVSETLLPGLEHLQKTLESRAGELDGIVKTGRTHLMDAMPVRMSQEIGGWAAQIEQGIERVSGALPRIGALAQGGTAVGTGINAHREFGVRIAKRLREKTRLPFTASKNYFVSLSSQDAAVELSGQMKTVAVSVMKIANDLRWMNSGPQAGIADIALPSLQPGSSIMPGKVNPVIPEAAAMVCAQVIGNDATITIGGQAGNFQLNVMLPVIAHNLLESARLLGNVARLLAEKAVAGFTVNEARVAELVDKNPILVTALNAIIGYEKGAAIAKRAYAEGRKLKDVALEMTDLSAEELDRLLEARKMTEGGVTK